ncbi:NAD(P)-dependent alcohol dehydrogenase [Pareuzebyella sediminis]|uniref:NAD(P)-dependent alcohol dehydrogenase n=1 Tax=Pareuzebyella sediminis TaxID=2607998 RepID=UPI0011EC5AE6|nr:NAD(P)-dependent alcohol dehydrogenase [Pareuzebyella sediminis]
MKAATRTAYGSPKVLKLRTIDRPQPDDNELLIRVYATTVNRTDCGILTGKPYAIRLFTGLFKPSSEVPGTDFAGQVEAIGAKVTSFQVGDRVWGLHDEGLASQAEYMVVRADNGVVPIPENITYQEAAASAEGAHYAYNFINKVTLSKGDKVLVNGATGAIGSAAVQLLKYFGAVVTAVGNTPNMALLDSLGAFKTFDYLKEDFTKDTDNYKFIFDTVGKSSFHKCKHLLVPGGVYISSELGPMAENLYLPILTRFKNKRVIFPVPMNCKRTLVFMNELLAKGEFKPVIDRIYRLEEIEEAYSYVMRGEKTGNVLISYYNEPS